MAFTNDILVRAQSDLQRAERDATNARDKLARAEAEINDLRAFLRKLEHYALPAEVSEQTRSVRSPRGSGGKARLIADFCIGIIQTAGRRVEMNELFPQVLAAGIAIGGRDEKSVLAGYLSRDQRVDFLRGEGWGIVKMEGAVNSLGSTAAPSQFEGGQNNKADLTSDPEGEAGQSRFETRP